MKIFKIPSTKIQIPGPDLKNARSVYCHCGCIQNGWWYAPYKSHQGGRKQIPMTKIPNMIRKHAWYMAWSLADISFFSDTA